VRDAIGNEAVPFRPYCGGFVTRTRNVSEYMLVLALCLVTSVAELICILRQRFKMNNASISRTNNSPAILRIDQSLPPNRL